MKKFFSSKMGFFTTAVSLIWIKSYLVYLFEFNLDIQNTLQHFLLFINPLSSALVFLGVALFAKGKRAGIWIITIDILMSVILYENVVFYLFNNDFIALAVFTQYWKFGSLGSSDARLVDWTVRIFDTDISAHMYLT